jgi:2-keto-4-pentenoate hydratase/2-oxohepta-3-ene-1,7-dioic acid hydratase in catechol pathway
MRLARYELEGEQHAGVVTGEQLQPLPPYIEIISLLTQTDEQREAVLVAARELAPPVPLGDVRLLAPLRPSTIRDFVSFEAHAEGMGKLYDPDGPVNPEWYEAPFFHFQNANAIFGPNDEVEVPPGCRRFDFELEVAAVIGRSGRDLTVDAARDCIAGYSVFNDFSARDLAEREVRMGIGMAKAKDFGSALGPWLVTADEIEPHRDGDRLDLRMRCERNGELVGEDTLASMAWSFEELIVYASRGTWIRPGDVIGSGTCGSGCLAELWGRNGQITPPPLAPGDEITLTVEGIGSLTNRVVAGVEPIAVPRARARHAAA